MVPKYKVPSRIQNLGVIPNPKAELQFQKDKSQIEDKYRAQREWRERNRDKVRKYSRKQYEKILKMKKKDPMKYLNWVQNQTLRAKIRRAEQKPQRLQQQQRMKKLTALQEIMGDFPHIEKIYLQNMQNISQDEAEIGLESKPNADLESNLGQSVNQEAQNAETSGTAHEKQQKEINQHAEQQQEINQVTKDESPKTKALSSEEKLTKPQLAKRRWSKQNVQKVRDSAKKYYQKMMAMRESNYEKYSIWAAKKQAAKVKWRQNHAKLKKLNDFIESEKQQGGMSQSEIIDGLKGVSKVMRQKMGEKEELAEGEVCNAKTAWARRNKDVLKRHSREQYNKIKKMREDEPQKYKEWLQKQVERKRLRRQNNPEQYRIEKQLTMKRQKILLSARKLFKNSTVAVQQRQIRRRSGGGPVSSLPIVQRIKKRLAKLFKGWFFEALDQQELNVGFIGAQGVGCANGWAFARLSLAI